MTKTKRERDKYITEVCKTLSSRLAEQGFAAEVTGRAKHLYSVYRKMQAQQSGIEQVHDLIAFRVVVESVSDCYAALGRHPLAVDARARPLQGLHRAAEAEHVPVAPHDGHRPGARAHRDPDPHARDAPRGRARHRGALEVQGARRRHRRQDAQRFSWLRQLLEWQKELKDPAEFLEGVKVDLFQDEVYVFTPKGDVRVFPRGATPIDFAYPIHTQLGDHVTGARINGKIEPLRYKLRNGDVVEVLTQPAPAPEQGLARLRGHDAGPLEDPQLPAPRAARQEQAPRRGAAREGAARGAASARRSSSRTTPR